MAFRQFCPVINDAFAFLDAFIKNQTVPRAAHYPMLEHASHDYVRAVKFILHAFTSHLSSIDAELSYDDDNHILMDYKQMAEHFKVRDTVAELQNRHYWSRHGRAFRRMMLDMLDDYFDCEVEIYTANDDWFEAMDPEFRCGFISFTECLELLCSLIAEPGRNTRANYQFGSGNWCILDSRSAITVFTRLYQATG